MDPRDRRIEYIKHLNTLSTGALLLIVTFLDKVFDNPEKPILAAITVGCFLLSVVGATAAYTFEIIYEEEQMRKGVKHIVDLIFTLFMWAGFLLGLIVLTIFSILNLV